jgi:hypothetical protein
MRVLCGLYMHLFYMICKYSLLFDRRAADIKPSNKCPCQFVLVVVEFMTSWRCLACFYVASLT